MHSTFTVKFSYMVFEHEDLQNNRPLVISLLIELLVFLSGYIHVTIFLPPNYKRSSCPCLPHGLHGFQLIHCLRAYACHECNQHVLSNTCLLTCHEVGPSQNEGQEYISYTHTYMSVCLLIECFPPRSKAYVNNNGYFIQKYC
jgi:hypothetical protein